MKPMRSLLFVPGHREGWPAKAVLSGTDGIILDLEDSVPSALKVEARDLVVKSIEWLAANSNVGIYVRVNSFESEMTGDDLERVCLPGLDGVLLPKSYSDKDIVACDALISHFERRNGVTPGKIEIIVPLETAQAYASCEQILAASPRVATLFAGASPGGDVERSIGYQFTQEGLETLYLRSRAVLAVRAAGKQFPLTGVWQDLKDLEGARKFAQNNRRLGFTGLVVIHPSHVAIANEVFAPSAQQINFYNEMIKAFERAEAQGIAAVQYEGIHIDYAHVKTARQVLDMHHAFSSQTRDLT